MIRFLLLFIFLLKNVADANSQRLRETESKKQAADAKTIERNNQNRERQNRNRQRRNAIAGRLGALYVAGAILLFFCGGVPFGLTGSWRQYVFLGFLPVPATIHTAISDNSNLSPYVFYFGKGAVSVEANEKFVLAPFANTICYSDITDEDISLSSTVLPLAKVLEIRDCNNIKTVDIPDHIKEIRLFRCEQLEEVRVKDRSQIELGIENCPNVRIVEKE